jgi:hypothetical protein
MSSIFQKQMESAWSKSIHHENCNRLKDSIQNQTSPNISNTITTTKILNKSIPGNDKSNRTTEKSEGLGTSTHQKPKFHFKDVFGQKSRWWGPTHFRLAGPEPACFNEKVQAGISGRYPGISTRTGLYGQDRPVTGLLSCSNFKVTQKIPQNCVQWGTAAADIITFRPLFSTSNLRSPFKLDCGSPTGQRVSSDSISGRLPSGKPELFRVEVSSHGGCDSSPRTRLEHKSLKVDSRTNSRSRVLRSMLEHLQQQKIIAGTEGTQDPSQTTQSREARQMFSSRSTDSSGPSKLCKYSCSQGPTKQQKNADFSKRVLPKPAQTKENDPIRSSCRDSMVEKCLAPCVSASTNKEHNSLLDHRCSGCRMGSPVKWTAPIRNVGQEAELMALESQGDVCSICGNKESDGPPRRCSYSSPDRQPHPRCLHQKGGGHEVLTTSEPNNQTADTHRPAEGITVGLLPPGEVQQYCRPVITRKTSSRVAFAPRGYGGHLPKVGKARNRLVRICRNQSSAKVRNTRLKRWFSRILQCIQSPVEVPTSMDLPSSQHNATSAASPEQSLGHIHTDCAGVESVLLDAGSSGTSIRGTVGDTEPTEGTDRQDHRISSSPSRSPGATGLEDWGWSKQISEWNAQERELLKKSWRPSTLTTYAPAIRRWTEWCKHNNTDSNSPSGHDVARFLANLHLTHNLAYNTILLHKSAIATYCANSGMLSKCFLVKQILKSISSAKPIAQKLPIWDTKILYDWLLLTTSKNTLFDTARRTAIILLLASGRRIHDLTLLQIAKESLIESDDDKIILWPAFGSKTDSATRRQSGWCLSAHPEERICPVKHIKLLISLSEPRRSTVQDLHELFITITGGVKQASKTNIAGWIRTIFREAGIDAPPGSVRSAVASKGWLDNRPIDEILERGNWKCFQTFKNHYYRSVQRPENNFSTDMLHSHFSSV